LNRSLALLGATVLSGCSLVFPLSDYDAGTGGASAAGGAASGAGDQGGGGSPPGPCDGPFDYPPVSAIVADFNDGLDPNLGLLNCATIENGEVTVTDTTGEYCWFYTQGSRRLTCDRFTVRILAEGSEQTGIQRFVFIREVAGDGELNLLQENGGFSLDPIALDPSGFSLPQDTWWRIGADENDFVTFETSADGVTWQVRGSGPSPMPLDNVQIDIGAGNWGGVSDPGTARFDCFNVAPPCP